MTTSYTDTEPTAKDRVRGMIGDTVSTDWQFSDEKIDAQVTASGGERAAAAELCLQLALKYARKADVTDGDLSVKWSGVSAMYKSLAAEFRATTSGQVPGIVVGGVTYSQRDRLRADTDRIPPPIRNGQFNNPAASPSSDEDDGFRW